MNKNVLAMISFLLLFCTLTTIHAWPYQLYSNGTIVDLNSSNSNETNLTIIVDVVNVTNVSHFNVTNVTNVSNFTGGNYSFFNVTNITNLINNISLLNSTFYNKTEVDNFIATALKNGQAYLKGETFNRDEIIAKLDVLNNTLHMEILDMGKETSHTWLWIVAIVALVIATTAVIMSRRKQDEFE